MANSTIYAYTPQEIAEIYERAVTSVYRICFMYMKNKSDAEDMTQNTFLKLVSKGQKFENADHEKAWLIRTAINQCKNSLKSFWNKNVPLDEGALSEQFGFIPEPDETLSKVLKLSPKTKTALCLYYYEGYSTPEIADIMQKSEATIRGYLFRGRKILKDEIEKEETCNGSI